MLYVTAAILIVLGFVFPKNKVLTVIMLLFMWALLAFNTDNADYQNYERIYHRIQHGDLWDTTVDEEGFIYLCRFCSHILKLNYQQFLLLYSTICTILLGIGVSLYTQNRNIVLCLFMFYSYWMMIVQIRSYLATVIVLIGTYFLISYNDKKSIAIFIASVFIGVFFHRSVIFILPLCLVRFLNLKKTIIISTSMAFLFIAIRIPGITSIVGIFLSAQKINTWLLADSDRTMFSIAMLILIRTIFLITTFWICKSIAKYYDRTENIKNIFSNNKKVEYNIFAERILKICIISFSYIALEAFTKDFERPFRLISILSYVLFADYTAKRKITSSRIPAVYITYCGYIFLFLAYIFYVYSGWLEIAFRPVFECNSLLN